MHGLTVTQLEAVKTLARMLSALNDELVMEGFTDPHTVREVLISATPALIRKVF
jgi:hypothetical protein